MRSILICLILDYASPLMAQTTISPNQLRRWGGGSPEELRLYAVALDGLAPVALGPGLRLEDRAGVLTLVAVPVEPSTRILKQDQNGNYVCPECTSRVYRNGIRMAPGVDYWHNGGGIVPLSLWGADDIVLAEVPAASTVARAAIPCRDWWRAPGCCTDLEQVRVCPAFDGLALAGVARLPTVARVARRPRVLPLP